ncbi:hypothetical protein H696_00212 [Fonticula alba]|uniref:Transposase IS30-like HTH domain-containing protein n=1 Tax=Fonticula alba TaxID=691883 RepID=A0A058ZFB8_FONAL|nr:hypothetical protein H696_00212 [Fonticula alba]KCV72628.1 hypothetical protein H696_00212 [Fonticula alba]|eukprot:XP_009492329.1 hypothetical protein H696_00212 [Fonticula alba]
MRRAPADDPDSASSAPLKRPRLATTTAATAATTATAPGEGALFALSSHEAPPGSDLTLFQQDTLQDLGRRTDPVLHLHGIAREVGVSPTVALWHLARLCPEYSPPVIRALTPEIEATLAELVQLDPPPQLSYICQRVGLTLAQVRHILACLFPDFRPRTAMLSFEQETHLLDLAQMRPPLPVAAIAAEVGLSTEQTRGHLRRLVPEYWTQDIPTMSPLDPGKLALLRRLTAEPVFPPSLNYISNALGMSAAVAQKHIQLHVPGFTPARTLIPTPAQEEALRQAAADPTCRTVVDMARRAGIPAVTALRHLPRVCPGFTPPQASHLSPADEAALVAMCARRDPILSVSEMALALGAEQKAVRKAIARLCPDHRHPSSTRPCARVNARIGELAAQNPTLNILELASLAGVYREYLTLHMPHLRSDTPSPNTRGKSKARQAGPLAPELEARLEALLAQNPLPPLNYIAAELGTSAPFARRQVRRLFPEYDGMVARWLSAAQLRDFLRLCQSTPAARLSHLTERFGLAESTVLWIVARLRRRHPDLRVELPDATPTIKSRILTLARTGTKDSRFSMAAIANELLVPESLVRKTLQRHLSRAPAGARSHQLADARPKHQPSAMESPHRAPPLPEGSQQDNLEVPSLDNQASDGEPMDGVSASLVGSHSGAEPVSLATLASDIPPVAVSSPGHSPAAGLSSRNTPTPGSSTRAFSSLQEQAELVDMARRRLSLRAIARHFGVHPQTVATHLRRLFPDYQAARQEALLSNIQSRLGELVAHRPVLSVTQIATEIGLSVTATRGHLRRHFPEYNPPTALSDSRLRTLMELAARHPPMPVKRIARELGLHWTIVKRCLLEYCPDYRSPNMLRAASTEPADITIPSSDHTLSDPADQPPSEEKPLFEGGT